MSDFDFETSDNVEDLIAYAANYNINVDRRHSVEKIKAAIRAEKKVIEAKPTPLDIASQRMVKLLIHKTESNYGSLGENGAVDVPVSVNGKTWRIKPGHEVEVPYFIVENLKNAVKEVYSFNEKTGEIVKRDVPAYPFSAMGV